MIAGVSVLVADTTSVLTPIIAGRNQRKSDQARFDHERATNDLDDLRALLDGCTEKMYEHTALLISLELWMRDRTIHSRPDRKQPIATGTRRELYAFNARLVVRRGRTDAFISMFTVYPKLTDEALDELEKAWDAEPFDYADKALTRRARSYWQAMRTSFDAATVVVSADAMPLPTPSTGASLHR